MIRSAPRTPTRPALALALLAAATGSAFAQAATSTPGGATATAGPSTDGPIRTGPSEIGGDIPVRLAVYDAQSFELSWERVPGATAYRLSRDGQVVQASNGVSRYLSGVDARASFRYALTALDRSGGTLATARFTVQPAAGVQLVAGAAAPTDPAAPPTGAVPAPTGVTARVYSSTAAELLWERAPASARVVRTEVSRDGVRLGSAPGNSFFDGSRDPARSRYAYELVAVAADGARSAPTTFPPGTGSPGGPDASGAPAEALERVAEAFELGAGVGLDAMYAAAERVLSRPGSVPGFARVATDGQASQGAAGTWSCPNGGTVRVSPATVGSDGDGTTVSLDATDCGFGDVRVTGDFEGTFDLVRPSLPERNRRWEVAGYRFRDTRPGGVVVETGGDTVVRAALPDDSDPEYIWAANLYRVTTPTGSYGRAGEVVVFDSLVDRDDPDAPPGLTVDLQRRRDGESEAYTGTPFRRATDGAPGYRAGTLSVFGRIGGDGPGYNYRLQSENGDPATFQLDVTEGIGVTSEGGTTTSYTVPWSDRFDFGTFDPSSVDFGL